MFILVIVTFLNLISLILVLLLRRGLKAPRRAQRSYKEGHGADQTSIYLTYYIHGGSKNMADRPTEGQHTYRQRK